MIRSYADKQLNYIVLGSQKFSKTCLAGCIVEAVQLMELKLIVG